MSNIKLPLIDSLGSSPKASDLMTKTVISVTANNSINECVKILSEKKITSLPIVNNRDEILSMISESQLFVFSCVGMMDSKILSLFSKLPVQKDLVLVNPETSIKECIKLMFTKKVKSVAVVERGGYKLVGILSRVDILKKFVDEKDPLIKSD